MSTLIGRQDIGLFDNGSFESGTVTNFTGAGGYASTRDPFTTPCVHFAMQGCCMKSPSMAPKAILTRTPMITPISIGKTTQS